MSSTPDSTPTPSSALVTETPSLSQSKLMSRWASLREQTRYLFDIDPRSLALFRVVFGTMCITDLWLRLPHLQMMYASSGWMPSHRVLWYASTSGQENAHPMSLLYLFNTTPMITAFFYGAMFCALCFTIGYRTRFFQILTAICMLSVHNRNTILHNGGDVVHNLWWMWTIWLPLGGRWSVDALLKSWKRPDPDDETLNQPRVSSVHPHTSFVAFAIIVNLALCYYLNGVHKHSVDWINGSAVPYVLEQDRIVTSFGGFAREYFPLWAQMFLTWSTLVFEASSPLFLLIPMVTRKWHAVTLTLGVILTIQMLSTTPLTLTLMVLGVSLGAWMISRVKAVPAWIPHALHTLSVTTVVYWMSFPLWLSLIVAATYTVLAVILIHGQVSQRQAWMRRFTLLALAGFHVGAGLSLQLGFFSYWMLSIYFLLISAEDWAFIKRIVRPRAHPLTLFYDGDCGVCHALARLGARLDAYHLITWVGRGQVDAPPGQLDVEAFAHLRQETIIATPTDQPDQLWTHHQAVAQTLRRLPLLAPLGWLTWLLGPVGRWMYQAFARRRHKVSEWLGYGVCGLPTVDASAAAPPEISSQGSSREFSGLQRLKGHILLGGRELGILLCFFVAMGVCFYGNPHFKKRHKLRMSTEQTQSFNAISQKIDGKVYELAPQVAKAYRRTWRPSYPQWARSFVKYGGFYQGWGLFTHVPKKDGWMIFEVKLSDGRVLDMRTGKAPSYEVAHYQNRSWGFYEARWGLKLLQRPNLRPLLTDWVKRPLPRMRLTPRDRVEEFNLYWVGDKTQAPIAAGPRPPKFVEKKLIHSWSRQAERLKKRK